ncbi:hypothetical protein NDU88_007954, partial [Pleurodeles waltl]
VAYKLFCTGYPPNMLCPKGDGGSPLSSMIWSSKEWHLGTDPESSNSKPTEAPQDCGIIMVSGDSDLEAFG